MVGLKLEKGQENLGQYMCDVLSSIATPIHQKKQSVEKSTWWLPRFKPRTPALERPRLRAHELRISRARSHLKRKTHKTKTEGTQRNYCILGIYKEMILKHVDGGGDRTGHRPEMVGMDDGGSLRCSVTVW